MPSYYQSYDLKVCRPRKVVLNTINKTIQAPRLYRELSLQPKPQHAATSTPSIAQRVLSTYMVDT